MRASLFEVLRLAALGALLGWALSCGGLEPLPIAGTYRSWIALASDTETITAAGCGGLSSEGTLSFAEPVGAKVDGRWDTCAGTVNLELHGDLLPEGWLLEVKTSGGLLSALPRQGIPGRMVFTLRGLGFVGLHVLVIEKAGRGHGKVAPEPRP